MDIDDLLDGRPFTLASANAAGMSRSRVRRLLASGELRTVIRGVYAARAAPDSLDLRARAAALVLPDDVVVCDRSAAWLHGIDILEFAERDLVPRLDVVRVGGGDGTDREGLFGGKRSLARDEIMELRGVRVTTPARTACDVACLRGRFRALATLDAFRRSGGVRPSDLADLLPRFRGRRGVIQLRELIPLSTDGADSQPESWTRLMIHDAGLPMPEPQVWTDVAGWGRCRMENAYEHLRIAVEYDGEEFHTGEEHRAHDRERRAALREMGWIIIVIRKEGLAGKARERWIAELRAAIAQRTPPEQAKRVYSRGPDLRPSYRRQRNW